MHGCQPDNYKGAAPHKAGFTRLQNDAAILSVLFHEPGKRNASLAQNATMFDTHLATHCTRRRELPLNRPPSVS